VNSPELLDKREVRIQRMFGQIAPWYDFLNHLLSLNIDTRWRKKVCQLVPPIAGEPILDLCTGTGDLAFTYDKAAKLQAEITGADFCHEMLVRAIQKGEAKGTTARVRFVEADAQQLPFPDEHFGIVSVSFGLRNITDPDQGLREMVRVLRPGGRLAVLEFSKPRGRILGPLYTWYFRKVLPRIGQMFSRNKESAYKYLPESVLAFPDGEALAEKLRSQGLQDVQFHPLTFGVATLYIGKKMMRMPNEISGAHRPMGLG
jgi:demethylmenaquinone methyltransferase / 2-methoxy-6-polyprenyl-1,4-benzoquinol methylase